MALSWFFNFFQNLEVLIFKILFQTDDKGVFATDLSQEYQLAAKTFNLSPAQMWDLSYESINYIFASSIVKSKLKEQWCKLKPSC